MSNLLIEECDSMDQEVMVSIICNTYNHERYIADAINSFLAQQTDFPIEILVHDDASTDRTPEIVRSFEQAHPDVIKPIYQEVNQYKKFPRVTFINASRAKGRYLALCEGDDYWTDPKKLQKQVEYLESHPEATACAHNAAVIDADSGELIRLAHRKWPSRDYSVEEIITGGGGIFPTCSVCLRHACYQDLPEFYFDAPVGDYPLNIYLAMQGSYHYMDELMSAYRQNVRDSWSYKSRQIPGFKNQHIQNLSRMFDEIDAYSNYRYSSCLQGKTLYLEFRQALKMGDYRLVRSARFRTFYHQLSFKRKLKILLEYYLGCKITLPRFRRR